MQGKVWQSTAGRGKAGQNLMLALKVWFRLLCQIDTQPTQVPDVHLPRNVRKRSQECCSNN